MIEKFLPVETIVVSDRENPDAHLDDSIDIDKEKLPIMEWYDFHLRQFMNDLNSDNILLYKNNDNYVARLDHYIKSMDFY